jgi:hypothetical protein
VPNKALHDGLAPALARFRQPVSAAFGGFGAVDTVIE